MKVKKIFPVLVIAASVGMLASGARASAPDPLVEGAKLCTHLLPQFEKEQGIPRHLLSAIASTESGRYHNDLKILVPWPWTINAAGKGYYLDSKEEAIATVKKLRKQGIQSIDVGCMQVNLYHHPKAFSSLEEAFDPEKNIAYAAGFLKSLHDEGKSWKHAAASYHSKEPARGGRYIGRVYSSWSTLVQKLQVAQLKIPENTIAEMRRMKPQAAESGVKYASLAPSSGAAGKKAARLSEQTAARKPAAYRSPHMKSISVSKAPAEDRVIVIEPAVHSAAVMPVADTGLIRLSAEPAVMKAQRTGPNFIFSD